MLKHFPLGSRDRLKVKNGHFNTITPKTVYEHWEVDLVSGSLPWLHSKVKDLPRSLKHKLEIKNFHLFLLHYTFLIELLHGELNTGAKTCEICHLAF